MVDSRPKNMMRLAPSPAGVAPPRFMKSAGSRDESSFQARSATARYPKPVFSGARANSALQGIERGAQRPAELGVGRYLDRQAEVLLEDVAQSRVVGYH